MRGGVGRGSVQCGADAQFQQRRECTERACGQPGVVGCTCACTGSELRVRQPNHPEVLWIVLDLPLANLQGDRADDVPGVPCPHLPRGCGAKEAERTVKEAEVRPWVRPWVRQQTIMPGFGSTPSKYQRNL